MEINLKSSETENSRNLARPRKLSKIKPLYVVIAVVVLIQTVGLSYLGYQYFKLKKDPNKVAQEEQDKILKEVGKLMELPQDETPSVATVTDKDKLKADFKDQTFFNNVENGDVIILYLKAQKAIIYRPSTKKIIEVAPIYLENTEQNTTEDQTNVTPEPEKILVTMSKGTKSTLDLTNRKNEVYSLSELVEITDGNQTTKTYTKSKVINVSGKYTDLANQIASQIGGEVVTELSGETIPEGVDIWVVVVK